jgi:hypothetical protein
MSSSLASGSSQTREGSRCLQLLDEGRQTIVRIWQWFPLEIGMGSLAQSHDRRILKSRRTSAHSRANTACRRAVSFRPSCSIEKTILAKFSAASPHAEAPVPSLLYWLVPPYETTCSVPFTMMLLEISLVSGSGGVFWGWDELEGWPSLDCLSVSTAVSSTPGNPAEEEEGGCA